VTTWPRSGELALGTAWQAIAVWCQQRQRHGTDVMGQTRFISRFLYLLLYLYLLRRLCMMLFYVFLCVLFLRLLSLRPHCMLLYFVKHLVTQVKVKVFYESHCLRFIILLWLLVLKGAIEIKCIIIINNLSDCVWAPAGISVFGRR